MGTDIHLYVERRDAATGLWRCVPPPPAPPASGRTRTVKRHDGATYEFVDSSWGPAQCMREHECYGPGRGDDTECLGADCPACLGTGRDLRWYRNRNYDVFAILTGSVRNGFGFAGVSTGDGFRGITNLPRNIPDDASTIVRDHNLWTHSPSWLLLPEITSFDWDQVTKHYGVIPMRARDANAFEALHGNSTYETWRMVSPRVAPSSYAGGVMGRGIKTVTPEDADVLLSDPQALSARDAIMGSARFYVRVEWIETYRESASDFLEFVDQMLVSLGDPANTRIVFGFDS